MTEAMDDWDFEAHWLYRIYDGFGRALCAGETNNVPRRLAEHMEKAWFRRPDITVKLTAFPNRAEALAAEARVIETEKPWYNKAGMKAPEAAPRVAHPKPVAVKTTGRLLSLRDAVRQGILPGFTVASIRKARTRYLDFPKPADRQGTAILYDAAELAAWATAKRSHQPRPADHSISA